MALLEIEDLHVKYGNIEVLHGINLKVEQKEIVAILGANGAGKSTTLMTISSLVKPSKGKIILDGETIHQLPGHHVVKRGVAQVPEGRRIFGTLTVQENMNLGAYIRTDKNQVKLTEDWIYSLLPTLADRRDQLAGTLSGGEQQMLAIGRALMGQPKLLLLDEPSLGLAPLLIKVIFQTIREINESGVTIVLVEQNARAALKLAHRGYVMELGKIVLEDSAQALVSNPQVQTVYLGGGKS
ncbi:MAG: ABC transporter ATP-binding protein [Desulfobacteraceae bacterium]|nr:ABC transporter ATP-binding protein [Desulfobacteraceae bacterium]